MYCRGRARALRRMQPQCVVLSCRHRAPHHHQRPPSFRLQHKTGACPTTYSPLRRCVETRIERPNERNSVPPVSIPSSHLTNHKSVHTYFESMHPPYLRQRGGRTVDLAHALILEYCCSIRVLQTHTERAPYAYAPQNPHLRRMHVVETPATRRATSSARHAAAGPPFPPPPTDTTSQVRVFPDMSGRRASTSFPPPPPPNVFPLGDPNTGCGGAGGGGSCSAAASAATHGVVFFPLVAAALGAKPPFASAAQQEPPLSPALALVVAPQNEQGIISSSEAALERESEGQASSTAPPPSTPVAVARGVAAAARGGGGDGGGGASPAIIASKLFHSRETALGRAAPDPLLPRLPAGFSLGGWPEGHGVETGRGVGGGTGGTRRRHARYSDSENTFCDGARSEELTNSWEHKEGHISNEPRRN